MRNLTRLLCVLGLMVSVALAESLDETRKKAENGDARAQSKLGGMYFFGNDVPKDYEEAVKWFRLAAEQGFAPAQSHLGVMYQTGEGVPKDYAEAVKWFRKSADQGNALAHFSLGGMYFLGEGVPKDLVQAHVWWNIAGANGNKVVKEHLSTLEKQMTPEQKAEAMKLARELFAKLPKKK